jgi:hypothetical protein
MSEAAARMRRRTIVWLAGAAGVAVLMGGLSFLPPGKPATRAEVGALVLPDFAANAGKAQLVMVTTGEESYHLVHNADGWVLAEKGSYRVEPERIAELTRALSAIRYARPMTREGKKFDRIGLGDPAEGGTGALLEVGDGSGTNFAKLIVGYRDGTSYVRMPDDLQAWAVDGATLPPLQRGARWLDLDVVSVAADQIADVQVRPKGSPSYRLIPVDETGQQFNLAPPHASRSAVTSFAPTLAATALSRFAPIDVAPANTVATGAPAAQYIVRTHQGVAVIAQAWRSADRGWVTIGAATGEGATPEARAAAEAINARTTGWAFALTELDWGVFATPLAALVE